jgi:hypothetical protein
MNHKRLLTMVAGLTSAVLLLVACGAPTPTATPTSTPTSTSTPTLTPTPTPMATSTPTPTPMPWVAGELINQATGEPLVGARVVLCQFTGERICTMRSNLTAVTDEQGKFHIADVQPGEYVVLYNGSGEMQAGWEGLEIDFGEKGSGVFVSIGESLGVSELSQCAFLLYGYGFGLVGSGYLYSEDMDLAFILIEDDPVSVDVRGGTDIKLSVWSTREGECDDENFDPLQ